MKFTHQMILAAAIVCLASCSEGKQTENATTGVGTTPVNFSGSNTQQPAATSNATGANPEHGQPGHRCDIPVGSPLNSPAQPNTAQPTTLPTPVAAPAPITTSTTAPGMNPPHGQPGHDCAIAVGAPLNK